MPGTAAGNRSYAENGYPGGYLPASVGVGVQNYLNPGDRNVNYSDRSNVNYSDRGSVNYNSRSSELYDSQYESASIYTSSANPLPNEGTASPFYCVFFILTPY